MSIIKRYTNIFHPHYTGTSRFILIQGSLAFESETTDRLAGHLTGQLFAQSVEISIDTDFCVQEDVDCPDGYLVRYLNVNIDNAQSCAQCGLYDTYRAALLSAENWKTHKFNKGLERFVYTYIAVPVIFKKQPIDPFMVFDAKPELNFDYIFEEEHSFHVYKDKKSYDL